MANGARGMEAEYVYNTLVALSQRATRPWKREWLKTTTLNPANDRRIPL